STRHAARALIRGDRTTRTPHRKGAQNPRHAELLPTRRDGVANGHGLVGIAEAHAWLDAASVAPHGRRSISGARARLLPFPESTGNARRASSCRFLQSTQLNRSVSAEGRARARFEDQPSERAHSLDLRQPYWLDNPCAARVLSLGGPVTSP